MKHALTGMVCCISMLPALATATAQVSGVTITAISIYAGNSGSQGAVITFSPGIAGLEGCTNTAGKAVWIDFSSATPPDGKSLYASVLAARLAGQVVTFGVGGCADAGQLPLVYRVDVHS
jgi:hypothetical protein